MSDLISRQAAIDEIKEIYEWHDNVTKERIIEHFVRLPSAQPERKTGKWVNEHWDGDSNFRIDVRGNCWYVRECSNCHEEIQGKATKYCPNCGARMKKGEEHV